MKQPLFLSLGAMLVSALSLIALPVVNAATFTVATGTTQTGDITNPSGEDTFDILGTLNGGIIAPFAEPFDDGNDTYNISGTVNGDIIDYVGVNQVTIDGTVTGETLFRSFYFMRSVITINGTTGATNLYNPSEVTISSTANVGDLIVDGLVGVLQIDGQVNDVFLRTIGSGADIINVNVTGDVAQDIYLDQGTTDITLDLDTASVGGRIYTSNFEIEGYITLCSDQSQNSNGSQYRLLNLLDTPFTDLNTFTGVQLCGDNNYVIANTSSYPGLTIEQDPTNPSNSFLLAEDDADGDGVNNGDEVVANTDPLRAPLTEPDIISLNIECGDQTTAPAGTIVDCPFEVEDNQEITSSTFVRIGSNPVSSCSQIGNNVVCSGVSVGDVEGGQDVLITLDGNNFFDRGDFIVSAAPNEDSDTGYQEPGTGPVLIRTGGFFEVY